MGSISQLARRAARLNQDAGVPSVPSLYFFTDPVRTPDPLSIGRRLPAGAAIVYRHFGASDRLAMARRLSEQARRQALMLLIGADPELAAKVGAHGVHWPERTLPAMMPPGFNSAAAHDRDAVHRAVAAGADVVVLGPVFATKSASGNAPLGLFRASQIAREAGRPIIALGGINSVRVARLSGRGFAGVAGIDAFVD